MNADGSQTIVLPNTTPSALPTAWKSKPLRFGVKVSTTSLVAMPPRCGDGGPREYRTHSPSPWCLSGGSLPEPADMPFEHFLRANDCCLSCVIRQTDEIAIKFEVSFVWHHARPQQIGCCRTMAMAFFCHTSPEKALHIGVKT